MSEDPSFHIPLGKRPSWMSVMNLAAGVSVAIVLANLIIWSTHKADTTDAVVSAVASLSIRVDRMSDKLDAVLASIPVIQEKVTSLEGQITDGRGAYATLDTRLRAIEQNEYANHVDAARALNKKP